MLQKFDQGLFGNWLRAFIRLTIINRQKTGREMCGPRMRNEFAKFHCSRNSTMAASSSWLARDIFSAFPTTSCCCTKASGLISCTCLLKAQSSNMLITGAARPHCRSSARQPPLSWLLSFSMNRAWSQPERWRHPRSCSSLRKRCERFSPKTWHSPMRV